MTDQITRSSPNAPAGILSIRAWFINKSSTYLSQAAPQNRLRNDFRAFICVIIKSKTPNSLEEFHNNVTPRRQDFTSWKRNALRSATSKGTQRAGAKLLPPHSTGTHKHPAAPGWHCRDPQWRPHSSPRRTLPHSQVVSFSPSIFGASALPGKAPQAPRPTTSSEFFQEHVLMSPSWCQNTHLLQLTPRA